ncbi:uncharacterized protein LOC110846586 isoform X2 [Folsomia candida]|uniref:uncharacterized protein LOC110846586 isoform X2 n=1 Tax=Folsomia candida TaxID=158441 RepID=UPI000B906838|nr:uncharacterized protein LOC110846586 isoform X2 [Folsomia candida]
MSTCPVTTTKRSSKCCEIPELPPCPPCPPANNSKDCKDEKKNKCPPMPTTDCSDCKPKWIECSPNATKMYPVPQGVQILPISVGGRNPTGGSCGKCGQDKPAGKPKVSANCPMMKPKCPGLAKAEDNSPGLFAKLASLFGKK